MWEKELEIIESLGKLYPIFSMYTFAKCICEYKRYHHNYYGKAAWVIDLCYYLNRRLPSLEEFIRENNPAAWRLYRSDHKIVKNNKRKRTKHNRHR